MTVTVTVTVAAAVAAAAAVAVAQTQAQTQAQAVTETATVTETDAEMVEQHRDRQSIRELYEDSGSSTVTDRASENCIKTAAPLTSLTQHCDSSCETSNCRSIKYPRQWHIYPGERCLYPRHELSCEQ